MSISSRSNDSSSMQELQGVIACGTTLVQHFNLDEGPVVLEPDVREYLPDSESAATARK